MAKASFTGDIRGLPVNIGLLVGAAVSFVAVLASFVGFQSWLDSRIHNSVDAYANVEVYPRIVELERGVAQIKRDQVKIVEMIETQDQTRNRQYGEVKKIGEDNNAKLRQVIDHLLVNK